MSTRYIKLYPKPPPKTCSLSCACNKCNIWAKKYYIKVYKSKKHKPIVFSDYFN